MKRQQLMQKFARWHIWLGWLAGVPLLMWTITGLIMVARPIEEVRGNHLRHEAAAATLPATLASTLRLPPQVGAAEQVTIRMDGGQPVVLLTASDGDIARFAVTGARLPLVSEKEARRLVARHIVGGHDQTTAQAFAATEVPLDFRRPVPVWQIALANGTHVYVGQQTGAIEAVRTPFWRVFDLMWGLHIMDLREREDTHHPVLILFAAQALLATLIGCVLLFRRRSTRLHGTTRHQ